MSEIAVAKMTRKEARQSADQINEAIEGARLQILEFYERDGWIALGYSSWRECVTKEFSQSQSYLYRQLDAAKIEREISPIGEKLGAIKEGPLRELKVLPEGKRAEAYQEAVRKAPDGVPTARQVKEAVNRRLSHVNGVGMPDPPEIAKARANGKIPHDAVVTVTQPDEPTAQEEIAEEHEQAKAQSEDELGDEDWLGTLPLASQLEALQLKIFKADALFWRHTEKARETFKVIASRAWNKRHHGPYHSKLRGFMGVRPPKDWDVCSGEGSCGGSGVTGRLKTTCPNCAGIGYKVHDFKKAR